MRHRLGDSGSQINAACKHQRRVLVGFQGAMWMCGDDQSSFEPPEVSEDSLQDTGKTMSS